MTPRVPVTMEHLHRLTARLQSRLPMWVVYFDQERGWLARMHISLPEPRVTRFVMSHDSVEELRGLLPPWMVRMAPMPGDDPSIIEVWL